MKKRVLLIVLSLLSFFSGYYILRYNVEPLQYFFYLISWWSYIVFVDAVSSFEEKRFTVLRRDLPVLIIISCGFWCIFEVVNLRIQNWFYINLPSETTQRYMGYFLSFGTVLPAVYATKELVRRVMGEIRTKPFHLEKYPAFAITLGVITLLLAWLYPLYFFSFAWIFLALILDGFNYFRGYASLMKDLERGLAGNLVAGLISGLICGILWETWNFWSVAKWVYTVPFFENIKIFEMPVAGYVGFAVFGLEVVVFMNFLNGVRSCKTYVMLIGIVALVFSFFAFTMIDKSTVFSYAPKIEDLTFISKERLDQLDSKGVRTAYGIDMDLLSEKEKEQMELLQLKGLGMANFMKLRQHGIESVKDLSRLDEKTLSRILGETNLRRVRVYLEAAKKGGPGPAVIPAGAR